LREGRSPDAVAGASGICTKTRKARGAHT
jgi:hypothetical protein